MTSIRLRGGKILIVDGGKAAISGDCCCEGACCTPSGCTVTTQSDCADAGGFYLGDGVYCDEGDPCEGVCFDHSDCPDDECCIGFGCTPVPCPTVDIASCDWCGNSIPTSVFLNRNIFQYNGGSDCYEPVAGSRVWYWFKATGNPTEIQTASNIGTSSYPVPGLSAPTGKTCRYVWVVDVGYGRLFITPELMCEVKRYYLYIDIDRCTPAGGPLTAVEDTSYSWPGGLTCDPPCDTDADGCMAAAPSITVTVAP